MPADHKEAALALGATRWEMIRIAVLPYSRAGITGASMLGLGRAIGETIAVTIVIGNAPVIGKPLFDQGYTLAAVIANEFGEAASDAAPPGGADRRRPDPLRADADRQRDRRAVRRRPRRAAAAAGERVPERDARDAPPHAPIAAIGRRRRRTDQVDARRCSRRGT